MEWEKEPKLVSSVSFEYEKGKTIVKRLIRWLIIIYMKKI
jgi:hypothetical protein